MLPSDFELIAGDNVEVLPKRFAGKDLPLLTVADAPYNYGVPYDKYDDHRPFDEYMEWTRKWLHVVYDHLHANGSLWLFFPDELVSFVDVFCQQELGLHKRAQVVWFYTFGVCNQGQNFTRSHCHLLYYTKSRAKFTFNLDAVRVKSARAAVYGDKRANPKGKPPDDMWILMKSQMDEVFQGDVDTWLENRVCGTYKERQKHLPNQIPVPLLERIVLACSNPGDLVLDPFGGSFSTGVASLKHGRPFIGVDISADYVTMGISRLAAVVPAEKKTSGETS